MYYKINGALKELANAVSVFDLAEQFEKHGIIFLLEDGEITGIGKESNADRE